VWSVASEHTSAARARSRLPGAVAHEQSAATSGVILFTGVFTLGSWLPSGFGVMLTVFSFESCFDLHKRHSAKTADAEWCQCVFVLNLPNWTAPGSVDT